MVELERIGKYEILDELGRGGFAVVYQAHDPGLARTVALKVLHPYWATDPTFEARFRREARTAARLRHPNVVTVHDAGEADGALYIAMEYLPGRTLQKLLEEGNLTVEQALPILEQLAAALDYAHGRGIIHRDVKPNNVIVEQAGRGVQVTLMDFGLVKALSGSSVLTSQGTLLGSPEYMAPEQADPARVDEIGPATDRYALGVVAYQMLAGRVPFPGNTPATLNAHLNLAPPAPRGLNPQLPPQVEQVLLKALAKKPADRYQSAGGFAAALRQAVQAAAYLAELYDKLQHAITDQNWAAAAPLCQEILLQQPDYQDVPELWGQVQEAQARQQAHQKEQQAHLARLYQQARAALQRERWEEARHRCADIEALQPGYRDVGVLLNQAEQGLRREQARQETKKERQAHLAQLYAQLQTAVGKKDWTKVLTLGGRIRAQDDNYRDVPQLMEQAREQLRRPPPRGPVPTWMWIVGGVAAVVLLVILGKWASGGGITTAIPTSTNTPSPEPPPANASLHDTWPRPADGMMMVYVPGGTFQMGSAESDSDADSDEFPQHPVTLNAFWIDQIEVTNAQYRQCVEAGECDAPTICNWGEPTYGDAAKDDHPAVCVDWHGADAYCQWAGAQLPTEAQWEYAAKGSQGYIYPWGNEFDCSYGNFDDETEMDDYVVPGGEGCDGYVRTAPAGSFPAGDSWCDALDLAGNVWEWTADWYGDYPSGAQTNPTGPADGSSKVLRGGSFSYVQPVVRASDRATPYLPDGRHGSVGFRCVAVAPGQASVPEPTAAPPEEPTEEPIGEPSPGITQTRPTDNMLMVYVPSDTFQMGSDESDSDADSNEFPQHPVTLDPFWIDQTEVSVSQFREFVTKTDYETEAEQEGQGRVWTEEAEWDWVDGADWQHPQGPDSNAQDDHPVVQVSWNDAVAYCEWAGARLPTEAEWEYAAKGTQGYIYPWGDTFDGTRVNFCDANCTYDWKTTEYDDGYGRVAPVGSFPAGASWCDARDLAGNVWEWTADWYGDYPSGAQTNPTGPTVRDYKVLRGGSFNVEQPYVRVSPRSSLNPDDRYDDIGFRCVAVAPGQASGPEPTAAPPEEPTKEPIEEPSPGTTQTRPTDNMTMVYVPSDTFQMGSDESDSDADSDEFPQHSVTLDAFWIDQTEVTNAQYRQCVEAGECDAPTTCIWGEPTYGDAAKDDHPAVCVDWHGADTYCQWAGAQLPTEAQWEYAAKGPRGYIYPWGDIFDGTRVNFCDASCTYGHKNTDYDDGYERTAPVGSFPAGDSWCDARDLAGNVWEWVADWYGGDYYENSPSQNPTGPATGDYKVLRGGSFLVVQAHVRASDRLNLSHPDGRYDGFGFRCVAVAPGW